MSVEPGEQPAGCCSADRAEPLQTGTLESRARDARPIEQSNPSAHRGALSALEAGKGEGSGATPFSSGVINWMAALGVGASGVCLVHCLAMPVVIALLPAFAAQLFEEDWFHTALAVSVLAFCLLAYIPGYLRHRDRRLIFLGTLGLSMVFMATFVLRHVWGEFAEIAVVSAGNLVLVAGHLLNSRLISGGCCPEHEH